MATTPGGPLSWPLDKYARLAPDNKDSLGAVSKKGGGSWIHFVSSKDAVIQLALLDSNHFMISQGSHVYESFSLWEAQKWIKGVSKGDSILFIYQLKEEARRFRIKFSAQSHNGRTALQACNECISKLSSFIPIRDMSSSSSMASLSSQAQLSQQLSVEDSQVFSQAQESTHPKDTSTLVQPGSDRMESCSNNDYHQLPINELAKEVCSGGKKLGTAYADTNFPVSQLGDFIRLCLTDSNFPGFVGAAEKELHTIIS